MKPLVLILLVPLAACGSRQGAEPAKNEAARVAEQIQKQGQQIERQADKDAGEVERALENESAVIFENRGNLLNETAGNEARRR